MSVIRCRGCGTEITPAVAAGDSPVAGRWADGRGFMVCVPALRADISLGARPDYVFHEPMPAGLDGGPEPANA